MLDLGALRMSIVADTEKAQNEIKTFEQKLGNAGQSMTKVGATLTAGLTLPIIALGTIAVDTASDISEGMNKLNGVYGESADEVTKWADNSAKSLGISKKAYIDSISTYGALSQDLLKMSEKDSAQFSADLLQRAADISSYYNMSMEESQSLIQQLYSGETEGWKRLGITINDTTLQEYANAQGIKETVSEMDLQEKTMLRIQYATEKTNRAQGDFAKTSDGLANSSRIMKAQLSDMGNELGVKLLPVVTDVVGKLNDWLTKILEFSKEHPNIMTMIVAITAAIAIVPPILMTIGGLITALTALSTALNVAMLPLILTIGGIILVIGALIAIGVLLYKNWDTVKAKCKEVFEAVKAKFDEVGNKFKAIYDELIKPKVDAFKEAFTSLKDGVSSALQGIADTFTNIYDTIASIVDKAIEKINAFLDIFRSAKDETGGESGNGGFRFNGSHYGGLDYVPYDGYIAKLHKGEKVITARENIGNAASEINVTQNIYSPVATPYEVARQTKNNLRELALNF